MPKLTRRAFLRASVAAAAGVTLYAGVIERNWLDITQIDMPLRRLPDAFAGFTIAQISDMHFGRYFGVASMDAVTHAVNELKPDAIFITGDIVTRVTHEEPDMIAESLARLEAPQGVFAVLGNHDWWEDGPLVAESMRRAGVEVLSNRHHPWRRGGQSLYLAGIDDVMCGKNDVGDAFDGIPSDAAVITLVHEPDYADILALEPSAVLQLSGHTHGGQICLPFFGPLRLPPWGFKYPSGMHRVRDLTVYTNRGVGVLSLPLRLACRPEVTLFTLRPV